MAQWAAVRSRREFDGALVLFQLGSFFEAFHDDARVLASTLSIALTARGGSGGGGVAMAGIPVHTSPAFIARLVRAGLRVVLCEQQQPPPPPPPRAGAAASAVASSGSALIRRTVTRIVTRGTLLDDDVLSPRSRNLLAALAFDGAGRAGVAWVDVSDGAFFVDALPLDALPSALAAHAPVELLLASTGAALLASAGGRMVTCAPLQSIAIGAPPAPRTGRLKIRYSALLFLSCAISPRDLRAALTGLSMTCYAEPRALAEKCVR